MIRHDCQQYGSEWWAIRRGLPTASQFHRIITPAKMGLSSGCKGYIAELIGDELNPAYPEVNDTATAAMRRGSLMEPQARWLYQCWANADVSPVGICLTDCGRFGTSPDGLVGDEGCVEFKCPSPAVFAGYVLDGGVPSDYLPQVHGHLLVTGRQWCDFFAYLPGRPPFIVRVEPNEFTGKLRERLEEFDALYQPARKRFGLPRKGAMVLA
jgi:YqaJ-like viral recombinase domain